jgi:hypothetical protein
MRTGTAVFGGFAASALLLFGAPSGSAEGRVEVARSAPFSKASGASAAVQGECNLERLVPELLAEAAPSVALVDSLAGSGPRLRLTISEVVAPGGGAFSGPKSLEVTGVLLDGERELGSFRAKRRTAGGPFGAGGTCGMLRKCARVIGQDVAVWLAGPTANAKLGDAR